MKQLGLFAKYWEPGQVKTRLAASIGDLAASHLHRVFLASSLATFQSFPAKRILSYWPPDKQSEFAKLAGPNWTLWPQQAGDLGLRMAAYFTAAANQGQKRTVLIGSDSPTLPEATVQEAFDQLKQHDVVIGPARDGGYYLIGCRGTHPNIFKEIEWGSGQVFDQTIQRLESTSLSYALLTPWYDIDHLEDLRTLHQELTDRAFPQDSNSDLVAVVNQVISNLTIDDHSNP